MEEEDGIIEILNRIQELLYALEKGMALNFKNQKIDKEERKVVSAILVVLMVPLRTPGDIICYSCGKTGYWRKNCLVRQYRCTKCHKLSHISSFRYEGS